uniref:Uncharacterized protein n=1 Tax=Rhizophora mucronata TaxID=61149 RepID=A0A2P2J1L6_RHIMU
MMHETEDKIKRSISLPLSLLSLCIFLPSTFQPSPTEIKFRFISTHSCFKNI